MLASHPASRIRHLISVSAAPTSARRFVPSLIQDTILRCTLSNSHAEEINMSYLEQLYSLDGKVAVITGAAGGLAAP